MNPLISVISLIIHVVFDAYIILLLLRFILQKQGASWHNTISQFVIQLTEKPIKPFRKILPGIRGFDLSIILLALIIQCVEVSLLALLQIQTLPNFSGIAVLSVAQLAGNFINIYIYAVIINAIISWVPTLQSHAVAHIIHVIVHPLLSRARRIIPIISGIDLSPIPVLLGLIIVNMLVITPLLQWGMELAIR